jgi:hypothetical protein
MAGGEKAMTIAQLLASDEGGEDEGNIPKSSEGEDHEEGESEGEMAAAEEVMDALRANDPHAFMSALKSFFQLCSYH